MGLWQGTPCTTIASEVVVPDIRGCFGWPGLLTSGFAAECAAACLEEPLPEPHPHPHSQMDLCT